LVRAPVIIDESIEILRKRKANGTKVIGIVQHGIFPDELVLAAGAIPMRIILGGEAEQEIGDQYLSPTTCPFGRSTLGFLERKHPLYSLIDTMIVGTFCNGVQNIANYLDNFQIPSIPLILPHSRSDSALKFYINELTKIRVYLEDVTGNPITYNTLLDATQTYNKLRRLLRQINEYRKQDPSPVTGIAIHELVWKAMLIGPEAMIPQLELRLQEIEANPANHAGRRIFLTGSGITLGDNLLQLIEEQCGGLIVADDLWSSMDYFLEDVDSSASDLLAALSVKYLRKNLAGRMIPDTRPPKILALYKAYHASGIINHTLKFCDSYSSLKPEFRKIMVENGIPVLDLDRDYAEAIGQIKTRIEAFLEMIA
jgi:benzoyl-CoA reductase/2-hydroxyglutaryl-CoA dehydratase subunit BcrC/BadD/HgdB